MACLIEESRNSNLTAFEDTRSENETKALTEIKEKVDELLASTYSSQDIWRLIQEV